MNGFYSYRTPHPASFSSTWIIAEALVSDLPEVGDDTYLLSQDRASSPFDVTVNVNLHHPITAIVGAGAELVWCLSWFSDGRIGGTYLRGLLCKRTATSEPATYQLQGTLDPADVGSVVTMTISLVLRAVGAIGMDASLPNEPGLVLFRQSRSLALRGAVPELTIEQFEFGVGDGIPNEIPYLIDLSWMPTDPDEPIEPGTIRMLINGKSTFAGSLDGTGEFAMIAKNVLAQAILSALLDHMVANPDLPNEWPISEPPIGTVGAIWRTALRSITPDGGMADLRALRRQEPVEYASRLMLAAWTGENR